MSNLESSTPDLFKKTLRTVIVLVGACVLFVGALSAAAVAITSRAFSSPASAAELAKPDVVPAKKPQSI
jgi:hypothetical protein